MTQALLFLADAVFGFFTALFLLRFFMQVLRVSFVGPLGQFVVKLTNWIVMPLRRIVPGLFGLDFASLLPAFLLQLGLAGIVFILSTRGISADPAVFVAALLLAALIGLVKLTLQLLIVVLIVQAVLSWAAPYSPLAGPLAQVVRPLLAPIRRVLPPISGIDLSPLIAILLVQFLLILLP